MRKNNIKKSTVSNPIKVVMQLVGAKWKIIILSELLEGEKRFSELKKSLGCTSKVLISTLKDMEHDGLIERTEDSSERGVYYYLTDLGYTMRPIVEVMQKWGREYKKLKRLQNKYEIG